MVDGELLAAVHLVQVTVHVPAARPEGQDAVGEKKKKSGNSART